MNHALVVWMNGQRVGQWRQTRGGADEFSYDTQWAQTDTARPLSLSIPLDASNKVVGVAVGNFFDNLLPDSKAIRQRIASRFRVRNDTFDLLAAIGRDCVGAVQLLPPDATPDGFDRIDAEPLDDAQIERMLHGVTSDDPLGLRTDEDDLRISIAGAQEKTALMRLDGRWCKPHGATPTTHIFKLPLGLVGGRRADMSESVANEWLCAKLIAALGLPVAATEMARFGQQQVLVVERFDRAWVQGTHGRWIARLPQEDFCQALGVSPDLKYESDGGPGMADALRLLGGSQSAHADRVRFLCAQLAFWLLAATDGHAKNYSIFLHRRGAYAMTPLYDVLSAWPVIGTGPHQFSWHKTTKLAMAVRSTNAHWLFRDITTRHWHGLAMKSGAVGAWDAMLALVSRVDAALTSVYAGLPDDFPPHVWETISAGMRRQAHTFSSGIVSLAPAC